MDGSTTNNYEDELKVDENKYISELLLRINQSDFSLGIGDVNDVNLFSLISKGYPGVFNVLMNMGIVFTAIASNDLGEGSTPLPTGHKTYL